MRPAVAHGAAGTEGSAHEVAAQFAALLFGQALAPLGSAIGFYGDVVVQEMSLGMARAERGGLTATFERAFEAGRRS